MEIFWVFPGELVVRSDVIDRLPFIQSTTWFVLHLLTGSITSAIEETLRGLSVARNLGPLPPKAEPRVADTPPPSPPPLSPLVPPALLLLLPQPGDSLLITTGYTGPGPVPGVLFVPFEAAESGTSLCRSLSDSCRLSLSLFLSSPQCVSPAVCVRDRYEKCA